MENYDDLYTYNGDTMYDMYKDSDFEINTDEVLEVFDEAGLYKYIDNLNDWD